MKEDMAVKDRTLTFVRDTLTALNLECKVIVAPSLVGVYINKSKDILMKTALSHHWKFQQRGLLSFVYHPILNRLKLVVVDEKSGRVLWQETFGDYTNYESIHPVFHILNSSKNFCQKIGLFFGDEKIATMVRETMEVFTAQRRRKQARRDRSGKLLARSKSFNSTEGVKIEVKLARSYSNSMGNIKIQRTALNLLEDEAKKYVTKQTTRRSSFRKMFSGIRSSFRVRSRRQEASEAEDETRKRSRLSAPGLAPEEKEVSGMEDGLSRNSVRMTDNAVDYLSANWKLSDVELEELYRLSYFKENNNVPSTDLCTTEL